MIEFVSGEFFKQLQNIYARFAVGSQEGLGTGLALKISTKWTDAQKQFKKYTFNNKFEGSNIFVTLPTRRSSGNYLYCNPTRYVSCRIAILK